MRAFLDGPRPWRWAVLLALLVGLPTLGLGLAADDHLLRQNLARDPAWRDVHTPFWDAFDFKPATLSWEAAVDRGLGPWWTHPGMGTRMFRPLTSLGHALDFQAWPGAPWLMHLHSILWYAALCALAAALYRRLVPGWAAGLAALFYVVDYAHGMTFAWIANRNALVAGTFGFAALLLHHHGRSRGSRGAALLSPLALAAGLAGGETALGAAAYLFAYALTLEGGRPLARLRSLWPHALVLAAWAAAYKAGGFGAHHSGLYIDPVREPLAFLAALPSRLVLELACELGGAGPDIYILLAPGARAAFVAGAAGVLVLAALALTPLLRRDRVARFFALGAVLASVPVCATFPSSRLMLVPGFGLVGLVARAFVAWRERQTRAAGTFFAVLTGGSRLVLGLPLLFVTATQTNVAEKKVAGLADAIPDEPALASQRVVVVNMPDPLFDLYLMPRRSTHGRVLPRGILSLALGTRALTITRADERTLVISAPDGLYGGGFSDLVRPPDSPIAPGTRIEVSEFTVEVGESRDGRPSEARFIFARPLEDASLRWLAWDGKGLVAFTPPPSGRQVTLPARRNPLWPF